MLSALDLWDATEQQLGIELDARSVAYAASDQPDIDLSLEQMYSLLWPRGRAARGAGRDGYSRFSELAPTDPLLLRDVVSTSITELSLSQASLANVRETLARVGAVRLVSSDSDTSVLQSALFDLIGEAVEVGSVLAYPRATGVGRDSQVSWATLEFTEALS